MASAQSCYRGLKGINVRGALRKQLASLLRSDPGALSRPFSVTSHSYQQKAKLHNKKEIARRSLQGELALSLDAHTCFDKDQKLACPELQSLLQLPLPSATECELKALLTQNSTSSKPLSLLCQILA